ncbi:MAG: hypothetical protein KDD47_28805, partial [Acidobacteria bacterium]|nr:hypothetical protein [Acidobacteriota bacterium]
MRLTVFTYKPCWSLPDGGFGTDGGFPLQMASIAELFDATTLWMPRRREDPPAGLARLGGSGLEVVQVPEPPGRGALRKIILLAWLHRL